MQIVPADTPELVRSIDLCNRRNLAENYTAEFYDALVEFKAAMFVAHDGTDVRGYAVMCMRADAHNRRYGHLVSLAVDKDFRRQGLARQLLDAAEAQISAAQPEYFTLEVREKNKGAIALYQGANYTKRSTKANYYADKARAYIMRKDA